MDELISNYNLLNSNPYIKCKIILKQIISHLNEKNSLRLIKHNKALENILSTGKKDYEEYNQILIELISV